MSRGRTDQAINYLIGLKDTIGKIYHADWIANSSSANSVPLTNSITLPPGTYIIIGTFPNVATNTAVFTCKNIPVIGLGYAPVGTNCLSKTFIHTLSETTEVQLLTGTSNSVTYSNINRGGLDAIRIR